MNFDIAYIEKIAEILKKGDLTEIVLQDGEKLIELKKEKEVVAAAAPVVPAAVPVQARIESFVAESQKPAADKPKGTAITSPMVGTFYKASSPTAAPFVNVGDTVAVGQTICIVEAMKLMNEIEAEVSGKITQICVEDGQPVEFGQVLMYVE